jgi:hypothetical protein
LTIGGNGELLRFVDTSQSESQSSHDALVDAAARFGIAFAISRRDRCSVGGQSQAWDRSGVAWWK